MIVDGKIFWGNLIINLIKNKMEGLKIEDAQEILKEVDSLLTLSGITFNAVNIHQFLEEEEKIIGETSYCSGVILSPFSYIRNKDIYFTINMIGSKKDLLKKEYTEEQLNNLVDTLANISSMMSEDYIITEILPRYKIHYRVGIPTNIIDTIDEVFNKFVKKKDPIQFKKERI